MRKVIFYLLVVVGLGLISCEKDSIIQEKKVESGDALDTKGTIEGYEIIDGVLHFETVEDLSQLADSLMNMSESELFEWEAANRFYSLYHMICDAEEDIFSDSLSFDSKLVKYKDLVYLDKDRMLQAQVPARFYQLICNKDGYFYVGKYKHTVNANEIIAEDGRTKSSDSRSYVVSNSVQTRVDENPRFPLVTSTYTGNKRRVQGIVLYIRLMAYDSKEGWLGQQILQLESRSGKKVLGSYKRYKTLHSVDALGFYCRKAAYMKPDSTYGSRIVRCEIFGGGGSAGEEQMMLMQYHLSPFNIWIPEKYIPAKEEDIAFVQTRVSTRGTGTSGAVLVYVGSYFLDISIGGLPFNLPVTGTPTAARPLVEKLNFGDRG